MNSNTKTINTRNNEQDCNAHLLFPETNAPVNTRLVNKQTKRQRERTTLLLPRSQSSCKNVSNKFSFQILKFNRRVVASQIRLFLIVSKNLNRTDRLNRKYHFYLNYVGTNLMYPARGTNF